VIRREYPVNIIVNARQITKVVIDRHYEEKHEKAINDALILRLVDLLNGGTFPVQDRDGVYEYYVTDQLKLAGKNYKLVWMLEDDQLYIGVVNAYRRK